MCRCQALIEFQISVILISCGNKKLNFGILTLRLWGLTYFDQFITIVKAVSVYGNIESLFCMNIVRREYIATRAYLVVNRATF